MTMPLVLIVEDSKTCAAHLAARLRARPHHAAVHVASSIHDAKRWLYALQPGRPDLVVLDVELPDGNGLDLLPTLHGVHVAIVSSAAQFIPTNDMHIVVPKGPTWATQVESILAGIRR